MRLIIVLALLLTACKPTDTKLIVDTRPPVVITQTRYVVVPEHLTKPCEIAEGPISQVIEVARLRRKALEDCSADKAAIRGIEGTPVK